MGATLSKTRLNASRTSRARFCFDRLRLSLFTQSVYNRQYLSHPIVRFRNILHFRQIRLPLLVYSVGLDRDSFEVSLCLAMEGIGVLGLQVLFDALPGHSGDVEFAKASLEGVHSPVLS